MAQPLQGALRTMQARPRLDPVLVVAVGCAAGTLAHAAPLHVGIAAAVALVALARGGAPVAATFAAFAFVVGALRAAPVLSAYSASRAAVLDGARWPSRCELEGPVTRSPARAGEALRIEVEATVAACDGGPFRGRVALHAPLETPALARGDRIRVLAQVAPPYPFWNEPGDPWPGLARRGAQLTGGADDLVILSRAAGVRAAIDRARAHVRGRIDRSFPEATAPLARALVLGDNDVREDDQRAFRRSGLAHLLAVSGMHLVLVVAGLVRALRSVLVRVPALSARVDVGRIACAVGVPAAFAYAELAGASGSAVRAAWMAAAALLARAMARRPRATRALALSICAMTFADPLVAFDLSFVLSAAATAGLVFLARPIERALSDRAPRLPRAGVQLLAASTAASVSCAPVLAGMAPELPLAGLVANLVAVPLGEALALPLCLAHAVLEPLPAAERGAALAASGALAAVRAVAHAAAAIPWGALPVPPPTHGQLAAAAVGVLAGFTRRPRLLGAAAVAIVALELHARARGAPRGVLRATFLDVGQGDATLVDLPDGGAMLVDGGGLVGSPVDTGARVIAPLLRARRRDRIDVVVLSHPHPDHYSGLRAALEGIAVGALWDTGQGEAEGHGGAYAELLADLRARGVPVLRPADLCGARSIGGATIEVLAPCPGASHDRGPNDNSLVLRIRHGARSILLLGDAEREEEHDLVARHALRADVVKVGHHGSRTSSTAELVAAVSPSHAVISCGVRNRFGHPHATTLLTLGRSGARVLRTDRDGAVVAETDGSGLVVRAAAER